MALDATALGAARQNAHPFGTPRLFENPAEEDTVGIRGELEFARQFGLTPDLEIRPEGDGGADFTTPIGRINVHTARKPWHLLVKTRDLDRADIFVQARLHQDDTVSLLGWATADIMRAQPVKVFHATVNQPSHYLKAERLFPMWQLHYLLDHAA